MAEQILCQGLLKLGEVEAKLRTYKSEIEKNAQKVGGVISLMH